MTQKDPEGPKRTKKNPVRLSKQRQTSQAAFAASSFSIKRKTSKKKNNSTTVIDYTVRRITELQTSACGMCNFNFYQVKLRLYLVIFTVFFLNISRHLLAALAAKKLEILADLKMLLSIFTHLVSY